MKVAVTPAAREELAEIWTYNADDRGMQHADDYLDFLHSQIEGLAQTYLRGRSVPERPDLRYIQMRRKNRGHGHVAVYSVEGDEIVVLPVFHTAQDWRNKLAEDLE